MDRTFVLYGVLATDPEVVDGFVRAALETSSGELEEIWAELPSTPGDELQVLQEGDGVTLEVERDNGELGVLDVRPRYIRGFPGRR